MNSRKILTLIVSIILASAMLLSGCGKPPQIPVSADNTPAEGTTPTPTRELASATATPDPENLIINFTTEIDQDVITILLVGNDSDSPDGDGNGRNDTTMVLQINRVDNTMKLISFMRDMVFEIPGVGETSLNNAFYYGGANTVKKLLKREFDIEIDYYASVSFHAFEAAMDIIGKISIDPAQNEIPNLTTEKEAKTEKNTTDMSPWRSLDYVRNRHDPVVDPSTGYTLYSDEARNYRQRTFIVTVWDTVKSYPTFAVPVAVLGAVTYVDTDMDEATIITLIKEMMDANATIETLGLPARRSAEKPYYSLYKDLNTEQILAKSEIEAIYASASDKDDYDTYEDWMESHYKVSHIIGWNVSRTTSAIENFLITD